MFQRMLTFFAMVAMLGAALVFNPVPAHAVSFVACHANRLDSWEPYICCGEVVNCWVPGAYWYSNANAGDIWAWNDSLNCGSVYCDEYPATGCEQQYYYTRYDSYIDVCS